jgi:hypothetical protein
VPDQYRDAIDASMDANPEVVEHQCFRQSTMTGGAAESIVGQDLDSISSAKPAKPFCEVQLQPMLFPQLWQR